MMPATADGAATAAPETLTVKGVSPLGGWSTGRVERARRVPEEEPEPVRAWFGPLADEGALRRWWSSASLLSPAYSGRRVDAVLGRYRCGSSLVNGPAGRMAGMDEVGRRYQALAL